MDFTHGDGSYGGERTMCNLLNELGEHRQRNNNNNNNNNNNSNSNIGAGLSVSPVLSATANPLKQCRSASDMDLKTRVDSRIEGPMKLARTDSFPFTHTDLKMHCLSNGINTSAGPHQLVRSNSMLSDGRLGYSPTNSSASEGGLFSNDGRLIRNDSVSVVSAYGADSGARTALLQQQPYYPFKPAGLPLSMGRETVTHMGVGVGVGVGMGMGMHGGHGSPGSRLCFTQSQWQELEHQALIFKYMVAGVPVPSDLVIPIRKSVAELTGLAAGSHHSNMGWSSFHLRFANNTDPEPGRCRRTDGKKWRCSRDVAPDQKYCERHMHRGRPRSRKPVEGQTANTSSNNNNTTTQSLAGPNSSSSTSASSISLAAAARSASTLSNLRPSISINNTHNQSDSTMGIKPFSSSGAGGMTLNNGVSNGTGTQFKLPMHNMVSGASALSSKDYRYMNWMKGRDMDEQMLFSEANSGSNSNDHNGRGLSLDSQSMSSLAMLSSVNNGWRLMPSKVPEPKFNGNGNNNSLLQYNSPQLRTLLGQDFGLMSETNQVSLPIAQSQQQQPQQQHSFLSTGFGAMDSVTGGRDSSEGQPLRHFFDDWPARSRDPSGLSWSDMEERSNGNSSTTQLSISIPMTSTDFSGANSTSPMLL